MEKYVKKIDGKSIVKLKNAIVVSKDGRQYINPPHDLLITEGWSLYSEEETTRTTYKDKVAIRREELRDVIIQYDSSHNINSFYYDGNRFWFDKVTRLSLMLRFESEKSVGKSETILWIDGKAYTLLIDEAILMLKNLEIYAASCYDTTQSHLNNINRINSIPKLDEYDYTEGYPDVLIF